MSAPRPSSTPVGRALGFERSLIVVLGLLMVLLGAIALVVSLGWSGTFRAQRPVLDPLALNWLRQHPGIAIPAAIGIGVVVIALGLWWLARALRPEPRPDFRLESGLLLTAPALTSAIRADAETVTGVYRAKVRTAGNARRRHLRLTLSLEEGTDVGHVWEALEDTVLARARQSLETDTLPASIRLNLDRAPKQRVR